MNSAPSPRPLSSEHEQLLAPPLLRFADGTLHEIAPDTWFRYLIDRATSSYYEQR